MVPSTFIDENYAFQPVLTRSAEKINAFNIRHFHFTSRCVNTCWSDPLKMKAFVLWCFQFPPTKTMHFDVIWLDPLTMNAFILWTLPALKTESKVSTRVGQTRKKCSCVNAFDCGAFNFHWWRQCVYKKLWSESLRMSVFTFGVFSFHCRHECVSTRVDQTWSKWTSWFCGASVSMMNTRCCNTFWSDPPKMN